jgi:hypothetical protein
LLPCPTPKSTCLIRKGSMFFEGHIKPSNRRVSSDSRPRG